MTTTIAEPTIPHLATAGTTLPPQAAARRHDIYVSIHKGLRQFMGETLVRVGRMDVADAVDRDGALGQLEELLAFCIDHLRHENEFVHTAIEARQPAGSRRIADEHGEHLESIAALRQEAATVRRAAPADAERMALRLYRHLALFVAENFQHMHIEETVHNAALWEHYSDDELEALHGRLLASIPPQGQLQALRWMVPAGAPAGRAALLGGAKAQMPPEALLGVMAMLRPHIDDRGWNKLAASVGVDPQLGRG